MPRPRALRWAAATALLAVLCIAGQAWAQPMTEAAARRVLQQVDGAIARRDVRGLGELLADDLRVSGTVRVGGHTQPFSYSKAQYLKALREGWSAAEAYAYRRQNERIRIENDAAVVTAEVVETVTLGGQPVAARTRETATIERVNGRPLVTRVTAHGQD